MQKLIVWGDIAETRQQKSEHRAAEYCVSYFRISISQLFECTVQSRFSDIKFSDNLWFSDYFANTIFQFTT